jgi:transposase
MWAAYANLVREYATNAQIPFDRFHTVKDLTAAVEEVRRSEMRRLSGQRKVDIRAQPLVAPETPMESHRRSELTTFDAGTVERAQRPRLLLQRSLLTVLELQATQASHHPSGCSSQPSTTAGSA